MTSTWCWLWYIYHKWKQMDHEHKMSNIPLAPAYTIPGQTATTLADDEIETMQPSAHAVKSEQKAGMNEISTPKISWHHEATVISCDFQCGIHCSVTHISKKSQNANQSCKNSLYPLVRWHYLTPQWQMKLHGNIEFLEPPLTKVIFLIFGVVNGY